MLAEHVWAVVGANEDRTKYGNMIYQKLRRKGYLVYAVNPRYETIEGDPCYKDLASLPQKPSVVNFVVAPSIGVSYVKEASKLGIRYLWFQPETMDDALRTLVEQTGIQTVEACVLVATR
jgi:hypothetical protein